MTYPKERRLPSRDLERTVPLGLHQPSPDTRFLTRYLPNRNWAQRAHLLWSDMERKPYERGLNQLRATPLLLPKRSPL